MVLEDLGDEMFETRLLRRRPAGPRSTSGRSTSWRGCAPAPSAARTRAASPSPAASTASSTAGSSTTSASGSSRPGRGRHSPPPSGAAVDASFDAIAGALAAEPQGLHPPRLPVPQPDGAPGGEQAVIDFQDALLGPAAVRPGGAAARQLRGAAARRSWSAMLARYLDGSPPRAGRASTRPVPGDLRPAHRAAQAEGRRPLRLHRPREEEPRLPRLHPGVAALRPRGVRAAAGAGASSRRSWRATSPSWRRTLSRGPAAVRRRSARRSGCGPAPRSLRVLAPAGSTLWRHGPRSEHAARRPQRAPARRATVPALSLDRAGAPAIAGARRASGPPRPGACGRAVGRALPTKRPGVPSTGDRDGRKADRGSRPRSHRDRARCLRARRGMPTRRHPTVIPRRERRRQALRASSAPGR